MAAKIGYINLFKYNFTFVFRHRFEKKNEDDIWDTVMEWREWELGFWYKSYEIVGKKDFHIPKKWDDNLVRERMFGINLLWCKAWFTVSKGGMNIDIDK
jgi:hypothetical protein